MSDPFKARPEFAAVLQGRARWAAVKGDSLEALDDLPDDSVDAIVTDPPAGIGFMGKGWDKFTSKGRPEDFADKQHDAKARKGSVSGLYLNFSSGKALAPSPGEREGFIDFIASIFTKAIRKLKPGGHALVWALPRTSHWTATGIEDAGFEIRDRIHDLLAPDAATAAFLESLSDVQRDALIRLLDGQHRAPAALMHIFGTGFPKNLDIAKAFDKANGVQPIGEKPPSLGMATGPNADQWNTLNRQLIMPPPTTPEALWWAGWGTALKPAVEHWILARKPLPKNATVIGNIRAYGTGAINVGACRVGDSGGTAKVTFPNEESVNTYGSGLNGNCEIDRDIGNGRWPAHLVLEHAPGCRLESCAPACPSDALDELSGHLVSHNATGVQRSGIGFKADSTTPTSAVCPGDEGGASRFFTQICAPGCPVPAIDAQTGTLKSGVHAPDERQNVASTGDTFGAYAARSVVHHGDEGGGSRFFTQLPAQCVAACPVAALDEQSGELQARGNTAPSTVGGGGLYGHKTFDRPLTNYDEGGGASRFFYQAKASRSEKNAGCESLPIKTPEDMTGRKEGSAGLVMVHTDGSPKANPYAGTSGAPRYNHHPTVKSIALMRWLCRLITPPGGVVVDLFMGSGSTGVAALDEHFRFIGIERDTDGKGMPLGYVPIARARLRHADPTGASPLMDRDPYTNALVFYAGATVDYSRMTVLEAMTAAGREGF